MAGQEPERGQEAPEEEPVEADSRRVAGAAAGDDARLVRVRPFREVIQYGDGRPATDVSGRIRGSSFVLSALGRDFALTTLKVGDDEDGAFAELETRESHHGEVHIQVEPEYEEPIPGVPDMPPGGKIAIHWGEDLHARAEIELAKQGKDPRQYIVLAPAAANSVSVYFDFNGSPNGTTCAAPQPSRSRTH